MKTFLFFVLLSRVMCNNQSDIAQVLTNYAKVSVNENKGSPNVTVFSVTTLPLSQEETTDESLDNDNDDTDYDDFDDMAETTERTRASTDNPMWKYASGLVNLLALAYFNGNQENSQPLNSLRGRPQPQANNKQRPRDSGTDPLADSINNLAVAQDRYLPNTATKKFKLIQGGYPPLNQSPVYTPPARSPAESYSSNGGKTSYDADSNQYMIQNPDTSSFSAMDAIERPKSPMNDYMAQNEPMKPPMKDYPNPSDPVNIQQSYSYDLPTGGSIKKKPDKKNQEPFDIQQSYSYELPSENEDTQTAMKKPTKMDVNVWKQQPPPIKEKEKHSSQEEKPLGPVYYPWLNKKPMPMQEHYDENDLSVHDYADTMPKSPYSFSDDISPWTNSHNNLVAPTTDDGNIPEEIPPWIMKSLKKVKPVKNYRPSTPEDDESEEMPPWAMKASTKSRPPQNYVPPPPKDDESEEMSPWAMKPPKGYGPPPAEADESDDNPPWAMKAPVKSKPPKDYGIPHENDDLPPLALKGQPQAPPDVYPYHLYPGHDHGLLYPGDDDHHHDLHEENDHDMKDEDRESKRPYTYYHLGRKLWYVPLLFSLYFIVYIASLLLKSIARHKVQFPEKLWEVHDHHDHHDHDRQGRTLNQVTQRVVSGIEKAGNKFM